MTTIVPTVGRVVWFYPPSNVVHPAFASAAECAAMIAAVLPDGKLNLGVLDSNGTHHAMPNVPLIQEGEPAPENGYYATWLPYQTGQAAKTEAAEKALQDAKTTPPLPKS